MTLTPHRSPDHPGRLAAPTKGDSLNVNSPNGNQDAHEDLRRHQQQAGPGAAGDLAARAPEAAAVAPPGSGAEGAPVAARTVKPKGRVRYVCPVCGTSHTDPMKVWEGALCGDTTHGLSGPGGERRRVDPSLRVVPPASLGKAVGAMSAPGKLVSVSAAHMLALADLKRSGLGAECLRPGTGIRALSRAEARAADPGCMWWRSAPEGLACLAFDYLDAGGRPTGMVRLRRLEGPSDLPRYLQRTGTRPAVWFSRSVEWPAVLAEAAKTLVVVEGEKKAEALCRAGIHALGLGGVWNTGSKRRRIEVLPELLGIEWPERQVVVCFDADEKPTARRHVARAATRLGDLLRSQGARVFRAALPLLDGEGDAS